MELKPYFQKGEKDMASGMKMLVRGVDSRLGIADSVWGSGKVSVQIGRQRQQAKGGKLNRLSGPWDSFKRS